MGVVLGKTVGKTTARRVVAAVLAAGAVPTTYDGLAAAARRVA